MPPDYAEGGKHNVELAIETLLEPVDVALDEPRGQARTFTQLAGFLDRHPREIYPGHRCPEPGEGQRVHSEVTLQMQNGFAAHVPEHVEFNLVQGASPLEKSRHVIERRADMNFGELIPKLPVRLRLFRFVLGHWLGRAQGTVTADLFGYESLHRRVEQRRILLESRERTVRKDNELRAFGSIEEIIDSFEIIFSRRGFGHDPDALEPGVGDEWFLVNE